MNINQQLRKLTEGISQLQATLTKKTSYAETARKRLHILNEHLAKLEEEKVRLSSEIAASRPQEFNSRNPKINRPGATLGRGAPHSWQQLRRDQNRPQRTDLHHRGYQGRGAAFSFHDADDACWADEIEQSLWEEETGEE